MAETDGFTEEERAAMKERSREVRSAKRGKKADGEQDVLAKIDEMTGSDRVLAERLHELVKSAAPSLTPKTWYGMPAYARDGKVVCFFQGADKFKTRYATLGFSDQAHIDEGVMWPTSFAVIEWTPDVKARISELVRQAAG
jgi:uncharacterized protein YdhG (YjbR/CyaY superfamily)